MSVGLLLITHRNIATSLLDSAKQMLDSCPLATRALEVPLDYPIDDILKSARKHILHLDMGDGVLILTDIYGATPANICKKLCKDNNSILVTGINLPMLIRILNYPQLNKEALALKAVSGGQDGILLCDDSDTQEDN